MPAIRDALVRSSQRPTVLQCMSVCKTMPRVCEGKLPVLRRSAMSIPPCTEKNRPFPRRPWSSRSRNWLFRAFTTLRACKHRFFQRCFPLLCSFAAKRAERSWARNCCTVFARPSAEGGWSAAASGTPEELAAVVVNPFRLSTVVLSPGQSVGS